MTKNLRKDLQDLYNDILRIDREKDLILKEFQEMSKDLGLPIYCGWDSCYHQLIGRKEAYTKNGCNTTYERRAKNLMSEYNELNGRREALTDLGVILYRHGFWKEV